VALPLNRAVFDSIAEGITNSSESTDNREMNTTFNNYGTSTTPQIWMI
jgi:hypothetical protein